MKAFGSLVKGLRIGIDLLHALRKEDHGILQLLMIVDLPMLSGLDELLNQFELALDNDFPHYQVCNILAPIQILFYSHLSDMDFGLPFMTSN